MVLFYDRGYGYLGLPRRFRGALSEKERDLE